MLLTVEPASGGTIPGHPGGYRLHVNRHPLEPCITGHTSARPGFASQLPHPDELTIAQRDTRKHAQGIDLPAASPAL